MTDNGDPDVDITHELPEADATEQATPVATGDEWDDDETRGELQLHGDADEADLWEQHQPATRDEDDEDYDHDLGTDDDLGDRHRT